ncbi:hypothetical protein GP5015_525 [gamma proteobacterium HTCC5015]|nr:hypothetical protein GP5015_525 [gamma proteobacterium HTCC5015]
MSHPIHFAHANGFPAGSYRRFFDALEAQNLARPLAIPQVGHNPQYPVTNNWPLLVDELCDYIEAHSTEPVVGMGHSLGACLTLLASHKRPELFRSLVLLDPPLAMGIGGLTYGLAKMLGQVERISPAGKSKHRRQHWPNLEDAIDSMASKRLFNGVNRETVRDYIESATCDDGTGGRQLSYLVEVECAIFNTLPHNIGWLPKNPHPGTLLRGSNSDTTRKSWAQSLARKQGFSYGETSGSHLFPMQYPERTAERIAEELATLNAQ